MSVLDKRRKEFFDTDFVALRKKISHFDTVLSGLGARYEGSTKKLAQLCQQAVTLKTISDGDKGERLHAKCTYELSLLCTQMHNAVIQAYKAKIDDLLKDVDHATVCAIEKSHADFTKRWTQYENRRKSRLNSLMERSAVQSCPAAPFFNHLIHSQISLSQ